jgi:hypothetical protein
MHLLQDVATLAKPFNHNNQTSALWIPPHGKHQDLTVGPNLARLDSRLVPKAN